MVRLEHANLVVSDINASLHFIQTAFPNWKVRGRGSNPWHGRMRNWLHVGEEDYYLTLNDNGVGNNRDLKGHRQGLAHLGFVVEDVDAVINRLQGAGYEIDISVPEHPHRKSVYFLDPAGFQFEFMEYKSENPAEKNLY